MVSEKNRLKVLDKSDLDAIHGASMQVLERTGVQVESEEALGILEQNGYSVDRKIKRVRMTESQVMEAVKSCQKNWRWHARSEKHSIDMVDGRTKFGPGAQCLLYMDPFTDEVREATLKDGILICRLLDALDNCSLGYVPIYPHDVPPEAMSIVMWLAGLLNSSKPCMGGGGDPAEFELMLKLAEIFFGEREALGKKNCFPGYIDPISPLVHDKYMTETLLMHARHDSPVFVMVMALAGATAPASLAGLLVQQNAEILSAVAMARCVQKTPKIVYGSVSCPMDMRYGTSATGAPEFSLIGIGSIQMARHYGLPSDAGAQSDSKSVDAQTVYEKTQSMLAITLAGADFADLGMGSTDSFTLYSPIQLIIDNEVVSNVSRIARGVDVTASTLSTEIVESIGPGGSYLGHRQTLNQFRNEHSQPRVSDRLTRHQWSQVGSKRACVRSRDLIGGILSSHSPDSVDIVAQTKLIAMMQGCSDEYKLEDLKCLPLQ